MGAVKDITDAEFQSEVLESEVPVIVDFWAPWCGPCKAVAPVLEEIARDNEGRLRVVKLNTEEQPVKAAELGIISIPTIYLYVGGEIAHTWVGAKPKPVILRDLEPHLS